MYHMKNDHWSLKGQPYISHISPFYPILLQSVTTNSITVIYFSRERIYSSILGTYQRLKHIYLRFVIYFSLLKTGLNELILKVKQHLSLIKFLKIWVCHFNLKFRVIIYKYDNIHICNLTTKSAKAKLGGGGGWVSQLIKKVL